MASAPSSSSSPANVSAVVSPTTSQVSPPPLSLSSPPPQPQPPISQPNATPDLPAPPPTSASPPLSSPVLSSPPPSSPPPPPASVTSPSPTITLSPPPPATTVPSVSAPPSQPTTPSPPLTTSPPPPATILSPPPAPILSPPPPLPVLTTPPSQPTAKSPPPPVPVPAVPTESSPPPATPSSTPTPRTKTPVSPSLSSPPPPPPTTSHSSLPPLPSPSTNSSVKKTPPTPNSATTEPPITQFPLATPTSTTNGDMPPQNGTTISPIAPTINRNSDFGTNKGSNSSSSQSGSQGLSAGAAASIAIVIVFLVASFIVTSVWYVKKKRRLADGYNSVYVVPSPSMSSPKSDSGATLSPLGRAPTAPFTYKSNYSSGSSGPKGALTNISVGNSKFFTYEELHEITNGFSAHNVLGEGGFGCVYKGQLQDGREVAVKRLNGGGDQGEREFQAEVEIISRVHHRHLVSLVGYCMQNEQRLLVYDYVPNNTLHYHLHGHGRPVLEWAIRAKVAAGAARGIAYLHEDCHPRIIHRDIKSSNILLDNEFEALVADFGLARLALDAATHVTTRVMGTFGYLAPEYASSGKLTERSDVFSFGVVLLELITGRKPVDTSRPMGDESLVEWARPLLSQALDTGKLEGLIDPRLEKNYNEVELLRMIEAAAACVRHSASRRPRMSQVVRVLDSLSDVDLTNGVQPGKSELFNVANSAEIRLFQKMAFGSQDYDFSSEFSQISTTSTSNLNPNTRKDFHNLL